jgi:U3 small nucleolar RNA-associated protein 18
MGLVSSARKGGGIINVLSTESMQWLCSCRLDSAGGIADFAWWCDGEGFCAVGKNGEVSEYSVTEQRVVARWWDEGAVGTTVIALGSDGAATTTTTSRNPGTRWVAVGSSSGIVNIYDRRSPAFSSLLKGNDPPSSHNQPAPPAENETSIPAISPSHRPTPTKSLANLTTPISHLTFSPDAQVLVMASRWKKNALRLVHLPSCTVYRNWPTEKSGLGRISAVAVSGANGLRGGDAEGAVYLWLAVGSEAGRVRLWEIRG